MARLINHLTLLMVNGSFRATLNVSVRFPHSLISRNCIHLGVEFHNGAQFFTSPKPFKYSGEQLNRPPASLRIGVLADSRELPAWETDLIRRIGELPSVSWLALIETGEPPKPRSKSTWSKVGRIPFRLVNHLERMKLKRSEMFRTMFDFQSIESLVHEIQLVHPNWSHSRIAWSLFDDDLESVREMKLDIILRMGSGIIRGGILRAAQCGILSLHHGDNRKYRGSPPGFWEVLNRERTSGFVLQQLTEELDGGSVIARGTVTTQSYFLRNQAHLFLSSVPRVVSAIESLASSGELKVADPPVPYAYPLYRDPQPWPVLSYAGFQALRMLRKGARRLSRRKDVWQVAIIQQHWRDAALWKAHELKPAQGTWIADPFVIDFNGRTYCFVEEFVETVGRGRIAVYDITHADPQRLGVAIEEEFHLSFPFVFKFNGCLFMCPESADAGQIRLYRCLGSPLHWELESVLIDRLRAVDTMLIDLGDEWLLLTNVDETGAGDFATGLWAYRASSPLSTEWTPDSTNPVVTDSHCMRNGGLVSSGDSWFRIGQIADFDSYGSEASIQLITGSELNEYSELATARLVPDFWPGLRGIHHMSGTDLVTAFDVYRD